MSVPTTNLPSPKLLGSTGADAGAGGAAGTDGAWAGSAVAGSPRFTMIAMTTRLATKAMSNSTSALVIALRGLVTGVSFEACLVTEAGWTCGTAGARAMSPHL